MSVTPLHAISWMRDGVASSRELSRNIMQLLPPHVVGILGGADCVETESEKAIILCVSSDARGWLRGYLEEMLPAANIGEWLKIRHDMLCPSVTINRHQLSGALKECMQVSKEMKKSLNLLIEMREPGYFEKFVEHAKITDVTTPSIDDLPRFKHNLPAHISYNRNRTYVTVFASAPIQYDYEIQDLKKCLEYSLTRDELSAADAKIESSTPDYVIFSLDSADLCRRILPPLHRLRSDKEKSSSILAR